MRERWKRRVINGWKRNCPGTVVIAIPVSLALLFATGWLERLFGRDQHNDD